MGSPDPISELPKCFGKHVITTILFGIARDGLSLQPKRIPQGWNPREGNALRQK